MPMNPDPRPGKTVPLGQRLPCWHNKEGRCYKLVGRMKKVSERKIFLREINKNIYRTFSSQNYVFRVWKKNKSIFSKNTQKYFKIYLPVIFMHTHSHTHTCTGIVVFATQKELIIFPKLQFSISSLVRSRYGWEGNFNWLYFSWESNI